jgi:hypothetical protein
MTRYDFTSASYREHSVGGKNVGNDIRPSLVSYFLEIKVGES